MQEAVYRVLALVSALVVEVPIGTNLGLLHLFWMLLSGKALLTRGAIIPGLSAVGLSEGAVRRAWAALGHGSWTSDRLVRSWARVVEAEGFWQPHQHGGYHPVAVDITAFWRPRLHGCPTSHYSATAGKALPAIPMGIIARIGSVARQRFGLPRGLVRADLKEPSPSAHRRRLLERAVELQQPTDVLVLDREFTVGQLQAARATVWVTRLLKNVTARRADPPPYGGRGPRPKRGELVRPLARWRAGREIAATPPDQVTTWTEPDSGTSDRTLRAEQWRGLVLPDAAPGSPTFTILRQAQDRDLRPGLHRPPAGCHASRAVSTDVARAVPRPLASRADPVGGQAHAGRRSPVRPRAGDLPTLPGAGAAGRGRPHLRRSDQPGRADRLLGSPATTHPRPTPTPARTGQLSKRLPAARTTSR